jgi:hypothetical protein
VAKTAVKLGTFQKMMKHKKKVAAALTLKITIIVVVLIIVFTAGAAAFAAKSGKACKYTGKFCKAEPKPNPKAAKALSFGTQSVIPPKTDSRRRRQRELKEISLKDMAHVLRGIQIGKSRRLAIDVTKFPEDSEYAMHETSYFVSEESADAMNMVNMIFCDIAQLRPDQFVDQPAYKAMVNEGLCTSGGSKVDWTVKVESIGDVETCVADATEEDLTCGYKLKIWFDMGGTILVFVEVWNPQNNVVPKLRVRFSNEAGTMTGLLTKEVSGSTLDLAFGMWHTQYGAMSNIHVIYDTVTKNGKVSSSAPPNTFKLAFDNDFAKKNKNSGADICLDLRDPDEVGNGYVLFDKDGKSMIFQEGFPVEADVSGTTCEAWVGYHGLHVQGQPSCQSGFADGKTVNKINYDASGTRTPYTIKIAHGKLWKYTKKSITLGELKGMPLTVGHGSDAKVIAWNGTHLVKVGETGGTCYVRDTNAKTAATNQKSCHCNGTTDLAEWWTDDLHYFDERVKRIDPAVPFHVDSSEFPWGMQVRSEQFHGDIALDIAPVATIGLSGSKSFTAGHTVTQGSNFQGTVTETSAGVFTSFAPCNAGINITHVMPAKYNPKCGDNSATVHGKDSSCSIYEGAILTQAVTGATGVVTSHGWVGHEVAFRTTSGTFDATNEITVSTPSDLNGHWQWTRIAGSFTPQGSIANTQRIIKVTVTSGEFQQAQWTGSGWSTVDKLMVNDVDFGMPQWGYMSHGVLKSQPSASTVVAYSIREMVMPGDTVPQLLCYERCPKASDKHPIKNCTGDDCFHDKPSILADASVSDRGSGCTGTPTFTFSNIQGSPAMTGVIDNNGELASVELTNVGHTCSDEQSTPTVAVGGLSCTKTPTVNVKCQTETDDPSTFAQAIMFDYNALSGDLQQNGSTVARAWVDNKSPHIHSGAMFEGTTANKNALKCENNPNQVCYHNVRSELSVFYEWETGSQYSKRVTLVDGAGKAVKFDQAKPISYVHSGTESNSGVNYDGSNLLLSYDGQLTGFPTFCMDQTTGKAADCDPWSRQTPDMFIPDGALITDVKDGTEYVVKAGEIEQIMKLADNSSSCSSLDTTTGIPAVVAQSDYKAFTLGTRPDLADVQAVVLEGVLLADLEKRAAEEAAAA